MTQESSENRKIYSLLEVSLGIRNAVAEAFPSHLWIKAEIAKLNYYPKSGHCYPDLVEKQNGIVEAQIRANIWSGQFMQINQKFRAVTGEPLKDGLKILFLARIGYHEKYGMALNIVDIEPSFTLGEMAREKLATIEKLKKEGVFEENKKRPFPLLPKRIAVISVETSKGFSDFVNVIQTNSWGYEFSIHLFPALLQGEGAIRSIGQQLREIENRMEEFDVVAIIRGGGGDVGLNAYDNYSLSKAVAVFPLPVITGIGHSTNETVVQMVAFANKITPTEAAHFLIQQFHNFSVRLKTAVEKINRASTKVFDEEKQKFSHLLRFFEVHTKNLLSREAVELNLIGKNLGRNVSYSIQEADNRLKTLSAGLLQKPKQTLKDQQVQLRNITRMLGIQVRQELNNSTNKLESLQGKLELLKPENVLKRGYSITYYNNKPVTDASVLHQGQTLHTKLHRGSVEVLVEKVNKQTKDE
ncbi:MAG: exodeoxyribonuclease VII large subunit [Bacteroidales bacterium]|nr:exodeoxyribonuclease VII large subunit [Bacteroidales bacterium]